MLKSVFTIVVFAAVTTAVFAQNLVLSGDVKNCKITSYDKKYFIKLQDSETYWMIVNGIFYIVIEPIKLAWGT